jgi:hypothetical protein
LDWLVRSIRRVVESSEPSVEDVQTMRGTWISWGVGTGDP